METSESLVVVEFHPAVRDVQSVQRGGKALAEIFPDGEIERRVLRQMVPRIALREVLINDNGVLRQEKPVVDTATGLAMAIAILP